MPTVTEDLDLPGGTNPASVTVSIEPWGAGRPIVAFNQTTGRTISGQARPDVIAGSSWSAVLDGNAALIPANTVYRCLRTWPGAGIVLEDFITVPATGGPYRLDQILTDPPASLTPSALAAHAVDSALHGGGQQLALAEVANNFSTTSTTFVDIPGASFTLTVPSRPYFLDGVIPLLIEESGATAEVELVHTSSTRMSDHVVRATAASHADLGRVSCPVPVSFHAPAAGTQVTYKLRLKTSVATSDVAAFVNFLGVTSVGYLRAVAA